MDSQQLCNLYKDKLKDCFIDKKKYDKKCKIVFDIIFLCMETNQFSSKDTTIPPKRASSA
jgi:hypothetical protein